MTTTLISALLMSMAMHAALVFFAPDVRPPLRDELEKNSIDVEMVKREVPLPDALRPKPLPEVPAPTPLDLSRLLRRGGGPLGPARLSLKVKTSPPAPQKIPGSRPIREVPELNLPRPATSLDSVALGKGASQPVSAGEIALPVGKPRKGKGLTGGKKRVLARAPEEIQKFEEEISRLVRENRKLLRRQRIRGPAGTRRIIFRPPPPKVKILESSGDIELKFWVLSDGTVGRVVPIRKGNAHLEGVAANHMKRWRFSSIGPGESRREEWGLIVYRFRVR